MVILITILTYIYSYYVPGIVLCALYLYACFLQITVIVLMLHLRKQIQRGQVTCLVLCRQEVTESGFTLK